MQGAPRAGNTGTSGTSLAGESTADFLKIDTESLILFPTVVDFDDLSAKFFTWLPWKQLLALQNQEASAAKWRRGRQYVY